ncbi:hypothetical protein [Microlunatus parietis]|uniref:Uncharacterized protein n=1 Tax=Microlunatus parietis TaxID=682979 RepID=A0A7Y9I6Y1_9ACTN|nr:hypothetical protein [Microlunatus parietis]NYE71407.1 hypothetical protein [Microlunatus parietis]
MTDDAEQDPADWLRRQPGQVREWIRQNNVIYGGMIAVALVLVQPFLTVAPLEPLELACVIAFAFAIPLLAALVMINQQETFRGRLASSKTVNVARALAMLASGTGIVTAFWNMSSIAGIVVLGSMVLAVAVHSSGYTRLEWPVLRRFGQRSAKQAEAAESAEQRERPSAG